MAQQKLDRTIEEIRSEGRYCVETLMNSCPGTLSNTKWQEIQEEKDYQTKLEEAARREKAAEDMENLRLFEMRWGSCAIMRANARIQRSASAQPKASFLSF